MNPDIDQDLKAKENESLLGEGQLPRAGDPIRQKRLNAGEADACANCEFLPGGQDMKRS